MVVCKSKKMKPGFAFTFKVPLEKLFLNLMFLRVTNYLFFAVFLLLVVHITVFAHDQIEKSYARRGIGKLLVAFKIPTSLPSLFDKNWFCLLTVHFF